MRSILISSGLVLGGLHALAAVEDPGIVVEAPPGTRIAGDFVAVYPNGFVARRGDTLLMGDTLRHDLRQHLLYAEGRVVMVLPPLRVHADRLGLDALNQHGEAWGIQAWVETPDGVLPIAADHLHFSREAITFTGLRTRRHGGILGIGADSLRIRLRSEPAEDRKPPANVVRDVTLSDVKLRAFGVPFFWLPVLFRDFRINYPWTQFRFGSSSRLGNYGIYRIATGFPAMGELRTRAELRFDAYSRAGFGIGTELSWQEPTFGSGRFLWFGVDETVYPLDTEGGRLTERWNRVIDGEHRARIPGGAVALRYANLPDRDPVNPATGNQAAAERFRNDYLSEDLNNRAFARQSAGVVWGMPFGAVVLDTERRPNDELPGTDRLVGLEAAVTTLRLLGPLHADAVARMEQLDNDLTDHSAWRIRADATARTLIWLGGIGVDGSFGGRGLLYAERSFAGVEEDGSVRAAYPYAAAGVRVRLEAESNGWRHSLTPRVGIDVASGRSGDDLIGEGFGDPRDRLEDDHRWVVTGIDTAVWRGRELFRASGEVRLGIRDADRETLDDNGLTVRSETDLVGIRLRATGRPLQSLTVFADIDWDARSETWNAFDTSVRWQLVSAFAVRYEGTYNPVPGIVDPWEHRPGLEILGNRYRLNGRLSLRPGGNDVDGWGVLIERNGIDGRFGLSFDLTRDADGDLLDRRFGVVFALY